MQNAKTEFLFPAATYQHVTAHSSLHRHSLVRTRREKKQLLYHVRTDMSQGGDPCGGIKLLYTKDHRRKCVARGAKTTNRPF